MSLKDLNIDRSWTLFLDRDGVINVRLENDYVKQWQEFKFLDGTLEAIRGLSRIFGKIIIVTNQQGIGKGIYSEEDLLEIHRQMLEEISAKGGRVDKIYFSPHLAAADHPDRKPGIGMALKAKKEFPEIDLKKSLMVGDSMSDMKFGKDAGMITVFVSDKPVSHPDVDYHFSSLHKLSKALR